MIPILGVDKVFTALVALHLSVRGSPGQYNQGRKGVITTKWIRKRKDSDYPEKQWALTLVRIEPCSLGLGLVRWDSFIFFSIIIIIIHSHAVQFRLICAFCQSTNVSNNDGWAQPVSSYVVLSGTSCRSMLATSCASRKERHEGRSHEGAPRQTSGAGPLRCGLVRVCERHGPRPRPTRP